MFASYLFILFHFNKKIGIRFIFFPQAEFDSIQIDECSTFEIDLPTGKSECTKDHPDLVGEGGELHPNSSSAEVSGKGTFHGAGYRLVSTHFCSTSGHFIPYP